PSPTMRTLLLFALSALLAAPAFAQRNGEAFVTQASNTVGTSVPDLLGDDVSRSPGVLNRFLEDPFDFSGLGFGTLTNTALVKQLGAGNGAVGEQDGTGNSALSVEGGDRNVVDRRQLGDDNLYGATLARPQ